MNFKFLWLTVEKRDKYWRNILCTKLMIDIFAKKSCVIISRKRLGHLNSKMNTVRKPHDIIDNIIVN